MFDHLTNKFVENCTITSLVKTFRKIKSSVSHFDFFIFPETFISLKHQSKRTAIFKKTIITQISAPPKY